MRVQLVLDFVHVKKTVQTAARVYENGQGLSAHARQAGNLENSARFDWLPDRGHGRKNYLKSLHLREHFSQAAAP